MCKVREHNAYQRVFWTSECRIAPLSGQSRIILTIEWIQCQVMVYCLYFIADNCPIWCVCTIRIEAYLPVVCVGSQKRKTNAIVVCQLPSITQLFRPVFIMTKRDASPVFQQLFGLFMR